MRQTRAAARLVGRMERVDMDFGALAPSRRVRRRACSVQSRRGAARSRAFPRSRRTLRRGRRARLRQGCGRLPDRAQGAGVGDRLHRGAVREPRPARGRACRARGLARAQERGRARCRSAPSGAASSSQPRRRRGSWSPARSTLSGRYGARSPNGGSPALSAIDPLRLDCWSSLV